MTTIKAGTWARINDHVIYIHNITHDFIHGIIPNKEKRGYFHPIRFGLDTITCIKSSRNKHYIEHLVDPNNLSSTTLIWDNKRKKVINIK